MSPQSNSRFVLVVGSGLAVFALVCSYPGGVSAAYRDATTRSRPEVARTGPNPALAATLADRVMIKDALVQDLILGRASLAEVTERFQDLNEAMPACMSAIQSRHPKLPPDQLMAVNVMEFVSVVDMPEAQKEAVFDRLYEEFEDLFGRACPDITI